MVIEIEPAHEHTTTHRYALDGGVILVRFTGLALRSAKPPQPGYTYLSDTALRGFGRKNFLARYLSVLRPHRRTHFG